MLRMDNDEKFQFTSHMLHVILLFLCFFLKTQLFPHDYARDDIVRNFFEIPETVLTVLHYVFLFFFFFFSSEITNMIQCQLDFSLWNKHISSFRLFFARELSLFFFFFFPIHGWYSKGTR